MSLCKYLGPVATTILTFHRVDDDEALKSKVNEALTVYDEYMKGRQGGANGKKEEEGTAEPTAA